MCFASLYGRFKCLQLIGNVLCWIIREIWIVMIGNHSGGGDGKEGSL
jgi:hypothetical protein